MTAKTTRTVKVWGDCDYVECPYNVGAKEFVDDGKCSYHHERCYIDVKQGGIQNEQV